MNTDHAMAAELSRHRLGATIVPTSAPNRLTALRSNPLRPASRRQNKLLVCGPTSTNHDIRGDPVSTTRTERRLANYDAADYASSPITCLKVPTSSSNIRSDIDWSCPSSYRAWLLMRLR